MTDSFDFTKSQKRSPAGPEKPTKKNTPPIQAAGRWKTADAYAKRRIVTIKDAEGCTVGFRPTIQQGRGKNRQTHSEVFRINEEVSASMAMAMAQRWRDKKESELGISLGQISSRSANRFVPGICLIVPSKPNARAFWRWQSPGHPTITKYMGKKTGFHEAYVELVRRICEVLDCEAPDDLVPPMPSTVQYAGLLELGIAELPDRRATHRKWTAR